MTMLRTQYKLLDQFDLVATHTGGNKNKLDVQVNLGSAENNDASIVNKCIPEQAFFHLRNCKTRNSLFWIDTKAKIEYLCFQWHPSDQKAICTANSYPQLGKDQIIYEYDTSWMTAFPFFVIDYRNQVLSIRPDYTIETLKLAKNELFIGGSNNISHFIGNFLGKAIHAFKQLSLTPVFFELRNWQREILDTCIGQGFYKEISLNRYDLRKQKRLLAVQDMSGCLIEDLPSYVGLPISLAIFADIYSHKDMAKKAPKESKIYLSRIKYEYNQQRSGHGVAYPRNLAWRNCLESARKHGYTIVYPEDHSFFELYALIAHASKIVCDFGSCSMHMLANSYFLDKIKRKQSLGWLAYQKLAQEAILQKNFSRNFEWLKHISALEGIAPWFSPLEVKREEDFLTASHFPHNIFGE